MEKPLTQLESDLLTYVERLVKTLEASVGELTALEMRSTQQIKQRLDGLEQCATFLTESQLPLINALQQWAIGELDLSKLHQLLNRSTEQVKAAEQSLNPESNSATALLPEKTARVSVSNEKSKAASVLRYDPIEEARWYTLQRISVLVRYDQDWAPEYLYSLGQAAREYAEKCDERFFEGVKEIITDYNNKYALDGWNGNPEPRSSPFADT